MTLPLPEKTWTVFYATSGSETAWYFFIDESAADSFHEKIRRAGYYPTMRPYHPTDAAHMTQEQAELLHAAADSVPRLTASAEPDYFPGKPTPDQVLVMRARIAAGCAWRGVRDTPDQEPEVRRILRDCATRLEWLTTKVPSGASGPSGPVEAPTGKRAQRARAAYETYQYAVWDPRPIYTFNSREPCVQEVWGRVVDAVLEVMGVVVDAQCQSEPLTNKRAKAAHDVYVFEQGSDQHPDDDQSAPERNRSWAHATADERAIWAKTAAAVLR